MARTGIVPCSFLRGWFAEGRVGCIGVLKDWLVDAVAATLAQKGTNLTEDILTRTMPHPARRVSLEMEARAGEHKVALHNSEGAKQLQALLKKPGKGQELLPLGSMPGSVPSIQTEQAKDDIPAFLPLPVNGQVVAQLSRIARRSSL